jgi:hypothetical protein
MNNRGRTINSWRAAVCSCASNRQTVQKQSSAKDLIFIIAAKNIFSPTANYPRNNRGLIPLIERTLSIILPVSHRRLPSLSKSHAHGQYVVFPPARAGCDTKISSRRFAKIARFVPRFVFEKIAVFISAKFHRPPPRSKKHRHPR